MALSTGLHGGLAFYGWSVNPVEGRLTNTPVAVSLLPAVDVASLVQEEAPQHMSEPASLSSAPRTQLIKQSTQLARTTVSAPDVRSAQKNVEQAVITKKGNSSPVEPDADIPPSEVACVVPQCGLTDARQVLSEVGPSNVDQIEADAEPNETENKVQPAALQRIEEGLLADVASATEELVQAVPHYRSNPLPEYPYQARKKHWEGVVWLLVDVSADGSVDELRVEKSCGYSVLDRTASRAVRRWQFTPAKRSGLAVLSQVRIPVRFHLEDN